MSATLARKSPFAGILGADGTEAQTIDGTTVAPVSGHETILVAPLKDRRKDVEHALEQLTGAPAPAPLGTAEGNGCLVVWTEPEQWLVRRAISDKPLAEEFAELAGAGAAVFNAAHGRVTVEVSGEEAAWVLAKLAGLDFHREIFRPGMAQTTMVAHVSTLIRRTGQTCFELTFMRSYAHSVTEGVLEACRRD